ncbi:MAG: hypothetical protein ISF22_01815 [Methanomassiliicoccus sp.]|nr:hypothetical protein [Methanomassiliicoccus sp.]
MIQESFRLLGESAVHRVGVRSIDGREEIEVLVRLCPPGLKFDIEGARRALSCLEVLEKKGYLLSSPEGWWVVGERTVPPDELAEEADFIQAVLAGMPALG